MPSRRGATLVALLALFAATAGCLASEDEPVSPQGSFSPSPPTEEGSGSGANVSAIDVQLDVAEETTVAWPGAQLTFHADLRAPDGAEGEAHLSLEAPASWTTSVSPPAASLASPTTIEVQLAVPQEADRQPPPILLHARDEDGQRLATGELALDLVQPRFRVPQTDHQATPGSRLDLEATLEQVPDELDPTIELSAPDGWQATVETHPDPANDTVGLAAQLAIPESAEPGRTHQLALEAAAETGSPVVEETVEVTVAEAYRAGYGSPPSSRNLTVLIVPPAHGPVANTERGALEQGTDGAAPAGAYLEATLHALADWRWALDRVAENRTELAWLADLTWETRIVTEDDLGPEHVEDADIVKAYAGSTFPAMGAAPSQSADDRAIDCLATSTTWSTYGSLTYEDMYQLSLHELLHCFGQGHVQDGEPEQDAMVATRDGPMTELRCPSNLNALATAAAYEEGHPADVFALEIVQGRELVEVAQPAYRQHCSPHTDTPPPEPVEP